MWHDGCHKDDFNEERLTEDATAWCHVVGPEAATFDPTGVCPRCKVPCTAHVQKNTLGKIMAGLYRCMGDECPELLAWIKTIKPGMPNLSTIISVLPWFQRFGGGVRPPDTLCLPVASLPHSESHPLMQ